MAEPKRSTGGLWTIVSLVLLLAAYPLSLPWYSASIIRRYGFRADGSVPPSPELSFVEWFYTPLGWSLEHSPEALQKGYMSYYVWSMRIAGVRSRSLGRSGSHGQSSTAWAANTKAVEQEHTAR